MAVKVNGSNVILYKVDTSTIPATETPFACSTNCTFTTQTELIEVASSTDAWFNLPKDNLSSWSMSCDGIVTLDGFSYDEIALAQKNRTLFLTRFQIDNGVDGYRYISGYCFIGGFSITGNYKEIGTYSVNLTGTGKYYTEATPTTTTSTTSTSTSTTTSTTSTTTTSTTTSTTTTTTTTTTTSTTTTTTQPPVWYKLYNCATGVFEYSKSYPNDSFALNDRVTAIGQTYRIDQVLFTNPGGLALTITATGLTGCPTTTTTTTTTTAAPLVNFDISYACSGGLSNITVNNFQNGSGAYQVSTQVYASASAAYAGTFSDETLGTRTFYGWSATATAYVAVRDKNNTINVLAKSVTPNCTTTTTTSTTTLPQVWYLLYNCATGVSVTSTNYISGSFALNDRVTSIGQTFRIDQIYYSDPGGLHLSISATGLSGCPATTTTTTTTTTLAAVNFNISYSCGGGTASITVNAFSGGSGLYQVSTQTYSSPSGAYGGAFTDETSGSRTFFNQDDTAHYVAVRDKNNPSNVLAKGITPSCATTTTTTTTTTSTTTAYPGICESYTADNNNGFGLTAQVDYTDCFGTAQSVYIADGGTSTFCAIQGTVVDVYGLCTITDNGLCP